MTKDYQGVIVKYNPCTSYARGLRCKYFTTHRECKKELLTCELPTYDKWFKDVIAGKTKCFYPKRITILETPDTPLFLFHTHYKAIVGEATINRFTEREKKHSYFFNEFTVYDNPVELFLLKTDYRLYGKWNIGQWHSLGITKETVNEIRYISKCSKEQLVNLKIKSAKIKTPQQKKKKTNKIIKPYELEIDKIRKIFGLNDNLLNETKKYLKIASEKKIARWRSFKLIVLATVYMVFRLNGIPKTTTEIVRNSNISVIELEKMYRYLIQKHRLKIPPINPAELIKSKSNELNLSKITLDHAVSLINQRHKRFFGGKAPSSIAASAVYVAIEKEGMRPNATQIAKIFGTTRSSVSTNVIKLKRALE